MLAHSKDPDLSPDLNTPTSTAKQCISRGFKPVVTFPGAEQEAKLKNGHLNRCSPKSYFEEA